MQIQGSGRVKLTDGTAVRVHYDGKNGHPYSSIGRYLIDKACSLPTRYRWARSRSGSRPTPSAATR